MRRTLLLLGVLVAGCARGAGAPALAGAPRWVRSGSAVVQDPGGARLVGVGAARLADGSSLARATAIARARAELTPLVERLVAGALDAHGGSRGAHHPAVARVLRETAQALVDTGDLWEGAHDVYARAELRVEALARAVVPTAELSRELVAALPAVLAKAVAALAREAPRREPADRGEGPRATASGTTVAGTGGDAAMDAPDPSDICLARLDAPAAALEEPSCISDDRVARWQGLLRYRCGGGEAEVLFGDARFAGTVTGKRVEVRLESELLLADGCLWRSEERIEGALDAATLQYRYDETPRPGEKDCEDPCREARTLSFAR